MDDPRFAEGQEHWIQIPAGEFYRGSRKEDDPEEGELDGKSYQLDAFEIGRYPVTNTDYERFVKETKFKVPKHWRDGRIPLGLGNHPVVVVSWYDAQNYIEWLNQQGGDYHYSLPTEAQWERAARGPAQWQGEENRRIYPWGNDFDAHKCNVEETGLNRTAAVGCFPAGASPEGVLDMSGNVFEWCADWYAGDYYQQGDVSENKQKSGAKVSRGGSFGFNLRYARCEYRFVNRPDYGYFDLSFRVARMKKA